jgi:hypothetical protein
MFGYSLANAMKCKWFAIGALASGTSNGGRSYVANLTNLSGGLASFSTASVESNGQTGKSMSMMPEGTGCSSIYLLCGARNGVIGPSTADNYGRADLIYFDGATWSSLLSPITDPEANAENYGFGEAVSIHTANRTMMIAAPRQPLLSTTNVGKVEFRKY